MPLQSSELDPAVRGSRKSTSGNFSRQIRAIAISAPECISGTKSGRALNSSDPVSLFNACRCAADLARGRESGWAMSNWATDRRNLGSVRKEMSQTPHGTSQRDHSGIAFRELVEARHDASVLFQPAKHALDDVALSVLGPIKQPW